MCYFGARPTLFSRSERPCLLGSAWLAGLFVLVQPAPSPDLYNAPSTIAPLSVHGAQPSWQPLLPHKLNHIPLLRLHNLISRNYDLKTKTSIH